MTWRHIRNLVLALVIAGVAYAIWGGPGPAAEVKEGPEGLYIQLNVKGEPFDYVCFAGLHYSDVYLPKNFRCPDCEVGKLPWSLIGHDEHGNPLRLAIRRGRRIDVYKIDGVEFEDGSLGPVGAERGYFCTRRHDDVARCVPMERGGCSYLFTNGIAAP